MRRALAATLAVPVLLLTACDDGGEVVEAPTATATSDADAATGTTEPAAPPADTAATSDSASTTETAAPPADDAAVTSTAPGDVEGGADGQAAADVAKEFFVASVLAEPEACDLLISFTDPETPMVEVETDLEQCRQILPAAMSADVEAQGLDSEEQIAILEAMQISGAEVDGDTATVDKDNLSELFQDALGEEVITLTRIDGTWYVDLDRSFQPAER
ncbi:hypothetical protein [Ornithinimicrobium cerasi]|uniref:hypothetical protein n=1 Tax=Ornithinimicrobium cerasi TaxID=2248773 RepID=UPI000EFF499F|nr:hypothetical protein [Ornithinimicrobium cerasi]